MLHTGSSGNFIGLSTGTEEEHDEVELACPVHGLVGHINSMNCNPEDHLSHVDPEEGKVNAVNHKFGMVGLSLPIDQYIDRTQDDDNMIDEIVLSHDLSILNQVLIFAWIISLSQLDCTLLLHSPQVTVFLELVELRSLLSHTYHRLAR